MNDQMQEAGLGVDYDDTKIASDFADLEAEKSRRSDRAVNWFFTLAVMALAFVAVFA